MSLIAILVFVGVFAVIAPVLIWWSGAHTASQKEKVVAVLDSAIGASPIIKGHDAFTFRKSDKASGIPWLNRRLEKLDLMPRLRLLLAQANVKWTPGTVILMSIAALAFGGYAAQWRTGSMIAGLAVGAVLAFGPIFYLLFMRGKRFGKFEQGLPEALDLIVSGLRAGHSLSSAMGLVTRECPEPICGEFRITFDEQNFGLDLRTALDHLVTRVPIPDMKMAVTAIVIQRESGGNLAEVLEKTSYMVRQRFRLKRQIMVHTAQGRLTGLILTALPVVLGIGLYIISPDNMSLLWKRDLGIKMLIYSGCSLVVGTVLIQKIVRVKV